jgi:hypothetical protein
MSRESVDGGIGDGVDANLNRMTGAYPIDKVEIGYGHL